MPWHGWGNAVAEAVAPESITGSRYLLYRAQT